MKFHPFVTKIQSRIVIWSLPQEGCFFFWQAACPFGWGPVQRWRFKGRAVVEIGCWKLQTNAHEVFGLFRCLVVISVSVFQQAIDYIVIIERG